MPKIKLQITGPVKLGGKKPGETFSVEADDDGNPVDIYWRRRLADERLYSCGAVCVVKAAAPPAAVPASEPVTEPIPEPKSESAAPATRSKKA